MLTILEHGLLVTTMNREKYYTVKWIPYYGSDNKLTRTLSDCTASGNTSDEAILALHDNLKDRTPKMYMWS